MRAGAAARRHEGTAAPQPRPAAQLAFAPAAARAQKGRMTAPGTSAPPPDPGPASSAAAGGRAPAPESRIGRAFATVGLWTLASRVVGFARDVAVAAVLGASPVAEAFLVALALPNMFRRFFAEGAFNMAFVPMFAKKLEADAARGAGAGAADAARRADPALAAGGDARVFARDALSGLTVILAAFTALAVIFMPALVLAMASGFAGDERYDIAVEYGRIAFPYILFISLAALLSGVLNATGRFAASAAAPILLNAFFLAALVLAPWLEVPAGDALAWAIPVAGVAQLAVVWWAAARAGYDLTPRRPRMTPELRRLLVIAAPAALAGGVVQVNLLVGRQVASFFDGAIAWLSYADRLYQLPLGVVGIAIGVVLLPDLSRRLRAGDEAGSTDALSRAGEFALTLALPSAVALLVVPMPIVSGLFERGAFGPDDAAATAAAVAVYGLGLPAFVLQKVWQPLYFAREDTRTPLRYALVGMAVNAALAVGLAGVPGVGYLGAAMATTVSAWVMYWLLRRGARRLGAAAQPDARYRRRAPRILAASIGMGAVLWALNLALFPLDAAGLRPLGLALLVLGGALSYAVLGQILGAFRVSEIAAALRR